MTITTSTTARNASLNGRVTTYGASATMKFYNGTKPASLGAPSGTLLATLTFGTDVTAANGAAAGGVTGGVLPFGGFTQTNSAHVAGTPTFVRLSTSGGTAVDDIDIGATTGTQIQFTGTIANAQNVTGTLTMTAGNA
jgi:hypothetical protein